MTENEKQQVWNVLCAEYQNLPQSKSERVKRIWFKALENYRCSDVTDAVMGFISKNSFFPHVADITANLKRIDEHAEQESRKDISWMPPYIHKNQADGLGNVSRYAREHGLSWEAAKAAIDGGAT